METQKPLSNPKTMKNSVASIDISMYIQYTNIYKFYQLPTQKIPQIIVYTIVKECVMCMNKSALPDGSKQKSPW